MKNEFYDLFMKQQELETKYIIKTEKLDELNGIYTAIHKIILEDKESLNMEAKKLLKQINNQIDELNRDLDDIEIKLEEVMNMLEEGGAYN